MTTSELNIKSVAGNKELTSGQRNIHADNKKAAKGYLNSKYSSISALCSAIAHETQKQSPAIMKYINSLDSRAVELFSNRRELMRYIGNVLPYYIDKDGRRLFARLVTVERYEKVETSGFSNEADIYAWNAVNDNATYTVAREYWLGAATRVKVDKKMVVQDVVKSDVADMVEVKIESDLSRKTLLPITSYSFTLLFKYLDHAWKAYYLANKERFEAKAESSVEESTESAETSAQETQVADVPAADKLADVPAKAKGKGKKADKQAA